METVTYDKGLSATYVNDALNRLIYMTNWATSTKIDSRSRFEYTLADNGMRLSVIETDDGDNTTTIGWTYDNLNRLLTEDYNALWTMNDYADSYVYDLVGNRKQYTHKGVTTYLFHNAKDELDYEASDPNGTNVLIDYAYNNNGSLTQRRIISSGLTFNYTYNLQNRLYSAAGPQYTFYYSYDADGMRIGKKKIQNSNGALIEDISYLIDSFNHTGYSQVFVEDNGANKTTYIIGNDILAQATNTNNPQYLLCDGHGSTRQLVASDGATINDSFNYDAYGNLLNHTALPLTNILYTGEMYDTAGPVKKYNLRSRLYDPPTGRFMTTDVFSGNIHDPLSLHKYLYCHANPINNNDPSGNMTIQEVSVTITIIAVTMAELHMVAHSGWRQMKEDIQQIEGSEAITLFSKGIQEEIQRNILEIDDPEFLKFNMEYWHEKAEMNKAVTLYNAKTEQKFLWSIDATYHSLEATQIGLGATGAIVRMPIFWSKPHPPANPFHWNTIENNAMMAAYKDNPKAIYTHSYLSTITNGKCTVRMAPDIAIVLPNGKIRIIEVLSPPPQTYEKLLEKGWDYKQALGDLLDHYDIIYMGEIAP